MKVTKQQMLTGIQYMSYIALLALCICIFDYALNKRKNKVEYSTTTGGIEGMTEDMDPQAFDNLHSIIKGLYDNGTLVIPGNCIIEGHLQVGLQGGLRQVLKDGTKSTIVETPIHEYSRLKNGTYDADAPIINVPGTIYCYKTRTHEISPNANYTGVLHDNKIIISGNREGSKDDAQGTKSCILNLENTIIGNRDFNQPIHFKRGIVTNQNLVGESGLDIPETNKKDYAANNRNVFKNHTWTKSLTVQERIDANQDLKVKGNAHLDNALVVQGTTKIYGETEFWNPVWDKHDDGPGRGRNKPIRGHDDIGGQ
jgi:hypothetical protein